VKYLRIYINILFLCVCVSSFSQADISLSTRWYNRANYNPASIARPNYLYLFTNVRQQWTNISGAPQTINIQASTYFDQLKSAFGISMISDQIGISQAINPMLTYAYRIAKNENTSLSFGLSAGIFSRTYNGSLFDPIEDDPALNSEINQLIKPDINFGTEFQSKYLIAGVSTTHLLSIKNNDSSFLSSNHRYAYVILKNTNLETLNLYAGIELINRDNLSVWEFNSSIRFKSPTGLITGARELFDIGISYRTTKQFTFLVGWNISQNFRLGYAYDHSIVTELTSNGSHEIMLECRVPLKLAQCRVCRNEEYWYR
jgi:type IX secretion system PorP/SprF family membrane protein